MGTNCVVYLANFYLFSYDFWLPKVSLEE
jgi:hypothetical protein